MDKKVKKLYLIDFRKQWGHRRNFDFKIDKAVNTLIYQMGDTMQAPEAEQIIRGEDIDVFIRQPTKQEMEQFKHLT